MSLEEFSLIHPLRVRWAEADMQGVVFNAHYLAYFDLAITEYWRMLAAGDQAWLHETFEHLFVVKATVDFHAPARFDDELQVATRCSRLGRSSMTADFEIHRGGDHLISGQSIYVYARDSKSMPIPEDLRHRIAGFEKTPPG
ncbi:MAG: acyl-CoA thioesterase [Lautropia sp.]|nr:acyl-CoA thioesterase [Lautropia sp.]